MDLVIDLTQYEISEADYAAIKMSRKTNIQSNVVGYIYSDKINELYNLEQTKNKWIIQYNDLLLILDYYLHEDNTGIKKK